jgi:hypothetical protein
MFYGTDKRVVALWFCDTSALITVLLQPIIMFKNLSFHAHSQLNGVKH